MMGLVVVYREEYKIFEDARERSLFENGSWDKILKKGFTFKLNLNYLVGP